MTATVDHAGLMDRVYRHQRHFYDATRKYYLLGRDEMLAGLNVPRDGTVLEIGCGTGRNLVMAARQYPSARLFGVDISKEMLRTSGRAVARSGLAGRTRLALADASGFDPQKSFGRTHFDRIYLSYAVSMIPGWEQVVESALGCLAPGGELHIVDFGDLAGLPGWSRNALYAWLRWYHVTPRRALFASCTALASQRGFQCEQHQLYRGYSWIVVIRRPDRMLQTASIDLVPEAA